MPCTASLAMRPGMGHTAGVKSKIWMRTSQAMWHRDVTRLRRFNARPFGVMVAPPLAPAGLRSESIGPYLSDFELYYGRPLDVGEPAIEIQTCFDEDDCYAPSPEEAITRAEHRDAILSPGEMTLHIDVFSEEPEIPAAAHAFDRAERAVVIDGVQRSTPVISYGNYEALSFRQGPLLVTAVARFGFPALVRFNAVDGLEPFFAASKKKI